MAYSVTVCNSGRYLITHPLHAGLAWSGQFWTQHSDGQPVGALPILTFESEEAADDYATENYLYPRFD
jgi:hypothetical protein